MANYPSGPNGALLRTDNLGNLGITNFTGNPGDVLLGNNTFGSLNAIAWLLVGNSGIDPNNHFIGTTDARPLRFRTNNAERMPIDENGNIFGRFRHITYHTVNVGSGWLPNNGTQQVLWLPSADGDGEDDCIDCGVPDFRCSWVAPYNGRLVKEIVAINQNGGANPDILCVLRLRVNGTDYDYTGSVINLNDGGYAESTLPSTGYSFSKGSLLSLGLVKRGNNSDRIEDINYYITAVWEYEVWD